MLKLCRIHALPSNFKSYIEEIASGMGALFGEAAAAEYRMSARTAVAASLEAPGVSAWAMPDDHGNTPALLFSTSRDGVGRIPFVHVLGGHEGQKLEQVLFVAAVEALQAEGVFEISCETIALCEVDLASCAAELGFLTVPRLVMIANAQEVASTESREGRGEQSGPCVSEREREEFARLLALAYREHDDRHLHLEVRSEEQAKAFVEATAAGAFGPTSPDFLRVIRRRGHVVGGIAGCVVTPGAGFVLQVAVLPEWRGRGLGALLLRELAARFREAGLSRIALAVTASNRARRLYERLGFESVRSFTACVWRRDISQEGEK